MFLTKLLHIIKSNIKKYKDEKQLAESQRQAFFEEDRKKAKNIEDYYEANRKFVEKEFEAEKIFIKRLFEPITNNFYILIGKMKQFIKR